MYNVNPTNIFFIDIETVPLTHTFDDMERKYPELAHLWEDKCNKMASYQPERFGAEVSEEERFHNAGIYAEYGKIVCISVGYIHNEQIIINSYYGDDEKKILSDFSKLLDSRSEYYLCGYNSNTFDFPFIFRRMIVHGVKVPKTLQSMGKKPWDMKWIDVMNLWGCGDNRHTAPLKELCGVLGIQTPKDDIDGSEVASVYYDEQDLDRIAIYCEKDVRATTQLYQRICGLPVIPNSSVVSRSFPDQSQI